MGNYSRTRQGGSGGEERQGTLSYDSGRQGSHHCKGDCDSPEPRWLQWEGEEQMKGTIKDAEMEGSWKHTGGGGDSGQK